MGQLNTEQLPTGTYQRELVSKLLIDLSWASSHLEGNTYSLIDTQKLIENSQAAEGKKMFETQMILNHKSAIELILGNAESVDFNRYTICNIHSALSESLLPNQSNEGRVRQHAMMIGKSVYQPLDIPQKINELFNIILQKTSRITCPFEQAFSAMVHLPYLQIFADVNKRTSRIAANIPLIKNHLCPLTFIGVSSHVYSRAVLSVYELTRVELLRDLFIWAYERSVQKYIVVMQKLAEPDPLRQQHRQFIKETIHDIVTSQSSDSLQIIESRVKANIKRTHQDNVKALLIEELRFLHEGVLARYKLSISVYHARLKREKFKG